MTPEAEAFFEMPTARLVGCNLFTDIAPAMNTPACRGRFLSGVRSGSLSDEFLFVFGRERGSLELRMTMMNGPEAGLYRIGMAVDRSFAPSRQREAMLAVDLRARSAEIDPSVCEREPIQTPGAIQPPHGLLAVVPSTFSIAVASDNIDDVLNRPPSEILGRKLDDILPRAFVEDLRRDLADGLIPDGIPERRDLIIGSPPRPFAVLVHLHDGRLLLEFEAAPDNPLDFGAPRAGELRTALNRLARADGIVDLSEIAVDAVQSITGYERVLVYKFDEDWNGEAVAERCIDEWGERLAGLRFPSSDIPRQARELYTRSPTRVVVDRDATPVPLLSDASDNRPVDLSFSMVRTLSPVHLEYQRNLGVNGSMSMAILTSGRLWGLMIGHHRRPHYVAPETRDAVSVVVDTLALRILDIERDAVVRAREDAFRIESALLEKIASADDLLGALSAGQIRLIDLFPSTGAAVVLGDTITGVGEVPAADVLQRLVATLRQQPSDRLSYASHNAETVMSEMARYADIASGVLVAFTDESRENALLWFRPEEIQRVAWGGDPNKPVIADTQSSAVLPRRSFERWLEIRRGNSDRWAEWEQDCAENLARATQGVALRVSRRIAELSAKQSELLAALDQKDLLTREIDHRVKNSLQIVSAFLRMQSRSVRDPDAQAAFRETYGRVMSIARVHDSLYQSDNVTDVDLGQTIENLCKDLAGVGGEKRDLDLSTELGLMVPYRKAVALCLIATELVTNAWKYAYPEKQDGPVAVQVARNDGGGLKLRVSDRGQGLPEDWEQGRTGLGMQLIKSMVAQIDATLHVQSEQPGASFTVLC